MYRTGPLIVVGILLLIAPGLVVGQHSEAAGRRGLLKAKPVAAESAAGSASKAKSPIPRLRAITDATELESCRPGNELAADELAADELARTETRQASFAIEPALRSFSDVSTAPVSTTLNSVSSNTSSGDLLSASLASAACGCSAIGCGGQCGNSNSYSCSCGGSSDGRCSGSCGCDASAVDGDGIGGRWLGLGNLRGGTECKLEDACPTNECRKGRIGAMVRRLRQRREQRRCSTTTCCCQGSGRGCCCRSSCNGGPRHGVATCKSCQSCCQCRMGGNRSCCCSCKGRLGILSGCRAIRNGVGQPCGDMPGHHAYETCRNYYHHRPYNASHYREHQQASTGVCGTDAHPYTCDAFERAHQQTLEQLPRSDKRYLEYRSHGDNAIRVYPEPVRSESSVDSFFPGNDPRDVQWESDLYDTPENPMWNLQRSDEDSVPAVEEVSDPTDAASVEDDLAPDPEPDAPGLIPTVDESSNSIEEISDDLQPGQLDLPPSPGSNPFE